MAKVKINARDMTIQVSDGAAVPTWTEIAGLTKFGYDPSEAEEMADTTTFADQGNANQEKMQKGAKASVEGFYIADNVTPFAQDAGQALVETWHELLGPDSQRPIRFRRNVATTWKVWNATVTLGSQEGENNDKLPWSAEFTKCGVSTTALVTP